MQKMYCSLVIHGFVFDVSVHTQVLEIGVMIFLDFGLPARWCIKLAAACLNDAKISGLLK